MQNWDHFFRDNQNIWNQRARLHKGSAFYDVDGFLLGKEVLTEIELKELGSVNGKSMLHLQCHFGLDTLGWARHGANVTGIDFSADAIRIAKNIAEQSGLPAEFICCNVYDSATFLGDRKFDIVFTSYGVVGWLPDLNMWGKIIRRHLRAGGIFYLAEFHPVLWMFDDEFARIEYPYHNVDVISNDSTDSYANRNAAIYGREHSWNHSISEVLNALLQQGLQIRHFNEFSFSPYPCFKNMVQVDDRKWNISGFESKLPMVYSIYATG